MTDSQKKPCQDMLSRLEDDLWAKKALCRVKDYPGVELEQLNDHVKNFRYLKKLFGEQPAFFIDEGRFIPYRAISYGNALVAYDIGNQLGSWSKCSEGGGRVTSSPGSYIFGTDVRMPDVAYSPLDTDRGSLSASTWMYRGEPFAPTFVVEVDKLSGRALNAQLSIARCPPNISKMA